jgi:hypothetical protein
MRRKVSQEIRRSGDQETASGTGIDPWINPILTSLSPELLISLSPLRLPPVLLFKLAVGLPFQPASAGLFNPLLGQVMIATPGLPRG